MRHRFDFRRLREHVERGDEVDVVARLQFAEITRECRRVARNVNESFRRDFQNRFPRTRAEAGRRRIDD